MGDRARAGAAACARRLDTGLLWGNLGVSLLVLVAGTYLVPALSLPQALLAIVARRPDREPDARRRRADRRRRARAGDGADAGAARAARLLGPDGAQRCSSASAGRSSSCSSSRRRRQRSPTSCSASARSGLWTLVFGGLALVLGAARPGRLRAPVRPQDRGLGRARVARVPDLVGARRRATSARSGTGPARAARPCSQGVDLVVAITVSWIPLAADYTRFSRSRRGAFWGTGGRLLRRRRLAAGARRGALLLAATSTDAAALPAAVAAGGVGAVARALRADGGRDRRGVRERLLGRRLAARTCSRARRNARSSSAVATARDARRARRSTCSRYQTFLLLLGSFFVPLFGVLLADWLVAGAHYRESDIFEGPPCAGA